MGKVLPKTIDKKFKDAYGRYWFMTMVNALRDENVQVSGILFILDFSDFPIRALSMFSPSETRDVMKYQVSRRHPPLFELDASVRASSRSVIMPYTKADL